LPVLAGDVREGEELQFCCSGCRLAYSVIHGCDLERFYHIRQQLEEPGRPALGKGASYAELDDETFAELYCRSAGDGLQEVELYLEGVHCAACVWLVERLPHVLDGVVDARLDLGRSLVRLAWRPELRPLSEIASFLDSLGYPPHPVRGGEAQALAQQEERALLVRIGVAGAIAGNVMGLAFALYGGYFHGIEPAYRELFRWLSLGLTLPSVLWCAQGFYRSAWGALKAGVLHMDLPISLGVLAGFVWGAFNTVTGTGEVYFDSVTVLVFLLLAGRLVQRRQQRLAVRATEILYSLSPRRAHLLDEGQVREVMVESLVPGQDIQVRAGETAPVDGVVLEGSSSLDMALLTGETRPVPVTAGAAVFAGCVNRTGLLRLRVTATGERSRLGRLLALVEEAARQRAPIVLLADRIAAWFVAVVVVAAGLTAIVWWLLGDSNAVDHAVAVLIVSCPCALGLATPLAVSAAISQATRRGILVKGGHALELLARPGSMLLDKTGTLTEGQPRLVCWHGDETVKAAVAVVEAHSSHPLAGALEEGLRGVPSATVTRVEQSEGEGMTAHWGEDRLAVGSPALAARLCGGLDGVWRDRLDELLEQGLTPVVIARNQEVVALAGVGDRLREDVHASVAELRRRGWRLEILSGDHQRVVDVIARELGLAERAGRGGVSPEGKVAAVRERLGEGSVVMVGDGVNDAAALATATVGIGVHGGAEASLEAADVALTRQGLAPLLELLDGARRTSRVIRRNLAFSLLYNLVTISLAVAGKMHPLLAAVLMPASSFTVLLSSYRARLFP